VDVLRHLQKTTDRPTPIGVKIGVFVMGFLLSLRSARALSAIAHGAVTLELLGTLASIGVYGVLLYAYWNLRRWALVTLAALVAFGALRGFVVYAGTAAGIRGAVAGAVLHAACLLPGFLALRRAKRVA
jgi:hypothetical protein